MNTYGTLSAPNVPRLMAWRTRWCMHVGVPDDRRHFMQMYTGLAWPIRRDADGRLMTPAEAAAVDGYRSVMEHDG